MFVFSDSQAQKDSVWQTLKPTSSHYSNEVEITVSKTITKSDSVIQTITKLPSKYINKVENKLDEVDKKLSKKTLRALRKFEKQEKRINKLLAAKDSLAAKNVFAYSAEMIDQLVNEFQNMPDKVINKLDGEYNAYLDTLKSTFQFLKQKGDKLIGKSKVIQDKLSVATGKLNVLEGKLQKAEEIKKYMRERKDYLRQQLEKFGMVKQLKKIEKASYYYSEYVKEYKTILKDRKKLEQKAMSILYKIPIFKKFVSENSFLTGIFKIPGNNATIQAGQNSMPTLAGIQTRANVQDLIQTSIASGGPNAISQIQQKIQSAQAELGKLKDKIIQYGSSDADIPSFKPNSQKTKSLLKRLEYGANIQFGKANQFMPTSGDIALSLGYKINDKSSIGIGLAYKIGLGNGWNNIKFSSEGIGIRSYIDWKIKRNIFVSGGYEQNYNSNFKNLQQLRNYSSWQTSGLIGVSKKIKLKGSKSTKIQLLYDFFSNSHFPRTQPFIYRINYNFK